MFHRLTIPSYFGGLSGDYGYINNGLDPTAAAADGAKVGGPNAGSFFHAFGEDATSSNFNRPIKALAQNCDFLDDLLHQDVAVMQKTDDVVAGVDTSSITIVAAGTYLGGPGYTDGVLTRARLFSVRSSNDQPILGATGQEVVVSAVVLSGGDAIGSNFSVNSVTLTLSTPIPAGTTYRVYHGVRRNFAWFPADFDAASRDFALIYGHTTMPARAHAASAITYAGGPAWADTTTNPAATVEQQLDKIVADLANQGAGGGADKVGFAGDVDGWLSASLTVALALRRIDAAFLAHEIIYGLSIGSTGLGVEGPTTLVNAQITLLTLLGGVDGGLNYNFGDFTLGPGGMTTGGGFAALFQGPVTMAAPVNWPTLTLAQVAFSEPGNIKTVTSATRYIHVVGGLTADVSIKPSGFINGNVLEIRCDTAGAFSIAILEQGEDDGVLVSLSSSGIRYVKMLMINGAMMRFDG